MTDTGRVASETLFLLWPLLVRLWNVLFLANVDQCLRNRKPPCQVIRSACQHKTHGRIRWEGLQVVQPKAGQYDCGLLSRNLRCNSQSLYLEYLSPGRSRFRAVAHLQAAFSAPYKSSQLKRSRALKSPMLVGGTGLSESLSRRIWVAKYLTVAQALLTIPIRHFASLTSLGSCTRNDKQ